MEVGCELCCAALRSKPRAPWARGGRGGAQRRGRSASPCGKRALTKLVLEIEVSEVEANGPAGTETCLVGIFLLLLSVFSYDLHR